MEARWILAMCDRFHCLPSALLDEDAELLRMLEIAALGPEREV